MLHRFRRCCAVRRAMGRATCCTVQCARFLPEMGANRWVWIQMECGNTVDGWSICSGAVAHRLASDLKRLAGITMRSSGADRADRRTFKAADRGGRRGQVVL